MSKIGSQICKNKKLNQIKNLLAPYTKRAYIVGGSVRDIMLKNKISDYDIEVYDVEPKFFDDLMIKNGANGAGKSYFVYKIGSFDISLPRVESKSGIGHKDFEVAYCNDERTASKRRDFTINSMMINIFDGVFLDFWGGEKDLKDRVLRHIDDEKFCEDSLRVLRAVQFCARLNLKIAPKTMKLMKTLDIGELSRDRISAEMIKIFRAKFQDIGLIYLAKLGLLKRIFGVSLSGVCLMKFATKLGKATKIQKDEREFLYFLARNFDILQKNLTFLNLPKSFNECFKQPFFVGKISDENLLQIAIKMPLKDWLGLNTTNLLIRAKKLGVYDKKFSPNIDMDDILMAGFRSNQIGIELEKRQKIIIKEYLKSQI